ncbi:MAG: IS66 family insertion sequence element accessory protein TnpB [Burkholderiales bacterium]
MFFPEGQVRVFVYGKPVSMRLSFDGLYALTRNSLGQNPLSGHLFAFINRRATQIKCLYFDRTGLCVWSKRLEEGRLVSNWDAVSTREMDWTGLKLLLEGIEPKRVRKRYKILPRQAENFTMSESNSV